MMRGKIYMTLFIFLMTCLDAIQAQKTEIRFNKIDSINGKPLGKINGIAQTPDGFMWFAGSGERCLYRYDGNSIVPFKHDESNPNSIGSDVTESVIADGKGRVWIGGSGGGLDQLDPATGIFKHYRHRDSDTSSLGSDGVSVLYMDREQRLWVGTNYGLDRLDEKTGKFTHYRYDSANPKSLSHNWIMTIYEDRQGVIWVGTGFPFNVMPGFKWEDGGLNRLNPDGSFTRYLHDTKDPHSLISNKVRAIFEDSHGTFWVGTSGDGLHTMDRSTGKFERHLYDPNKPDQLSRPPLKTGTDWDHITFILEDSSGAVWIGTYLEGLSRYDPLTKKITRYNAGNGYSDSTTWSGFVSREGQIWVSTEISTTLFRRDPSIKTVTDIRNGVWVHSYHESPDGTFLVGTNDGLFLYDQQFHLIRRFKLEQADPSGPAQKEVNVLLQNPMEETMWVGTNKGIGTMNTITNQFSRISFAGKSAGLDSAVTINIVQEKPDIFWIATFGEGLLQYNNKDHSVKQFLPDPHDTGSISGRNVVNVFKDRENNIWAAVAFGGTGFNRFDRQTGKFRHYLSGLLCMCLFQDQEGQLWGGTQTKGLYRYNKNTDSFSPFFDSQSDLSKGMINGITEDNHKNLWLSTSGSAVKINPARDASFIYDERFGLPGGDMNYHPLYKTSKGQILMGHDEGFYVISPGDLDVSLKPLNILLTDFFISSHPDPYGKDSVLQKNIEALSEISLAHDQNTFGIKYVTIDYRSSKPVAFYTMLENYDPFWREAGVDKTAYYFNLAPGEYIFRVKAYNRNGITGEKQIRIRIMPPWWKTVWAYIAYGLLLIAGIFLFVRIQKQRILRNERQRTQEKELAQAKEIEKAYTELKATQAQLIQSEKMASLGELTAGIAHEIQNPMNFINNFSDINAELIDEMNEEIKAGKAAEASDVAKTIKENNAKINFHGKRADSIIKGMLMHSRTSGGTREPVDINQLADEYLRLAYHGLRARDQSFNVTIETDFDPAVPKINVVPQDIGRVLLNLFNNSFYAVGEKGKQAGQEYKSTVRVSTKKEGNQLELRIRDNGNGIPKKVLDKIFQPFFTTKPTGQGTGLGLSLSYDIMKAHGGELKAETEEGKFAEFILRLPLLD
jgi:signal transduction histidine kinase/ligand-binding sensor domain-containing protein